MQHIKYETSLLLFIQKMPDSFNSNILVYIAWTYLSYCASLLSSWTNITGSPGNHEATCLILYFSDKTTNQRHLVSLTI
jgi:hypothetical protein